MIHTQTRLRLIPIFEPVFAVFKAGNHMSRICNNSAIIAKDM